MCARFSQCGGSAGARENPNVHSTIINTVSLALLLAASVLCIQLIRVTGRRSAWSMLGLAVILLALERCTAMALAPAGSALSASPAWAWITLVVCALVAVGIAGVTRVFESLTADVESLRRRERRFETIASCSFDWQLCIDPKGEIIWMSPSVERITGYTVEECMAMPGFPLAIVYSEDAEQMRPVLANVTEATTGNDEMFRIQTKRGAIAWVAASWQPMFGQDGEHLGQCFGIRDMTHRKHADDAFRSIDEQFRLFVQSVEDHAIYTLNPEGRVISWNPSAERIFGYEVADILGEPVAQICAPEEISKRDPMTMLTAASRVGWCEFEALGLRKDGTKLWVDVVITALRHEDGHLRGYFVVARNSSDRRRIEEELRQRNRELEHLSNELQLMNAELERLTRVDPLTELLNRRAWEEAAELEHARSQRTGRPYSVIMIDLDHFKRLNDALGHQAGDRCLRLVAKCIQQTCRSVDIVGRYGGEEFVILAPETDARQAVDLAERIRLCLCEANIPHPASPVANRMTASFGVAAGGERGIAATANEADQALYQAKKAGRNKVCHGEHTVLI